jgi:hypothetical protein
MRRFGLHIPPLALAALAASAPASASGQASRAVTGSVPAGWGVIALAENGRAATAAVSPSGRFRVVPPARNVTLQLRTPAGTYGGPVVLRRLRGNRQIVGLRGGAELGALRVTRGYGRTTARFTRLPAADPERVSYGRRGRPAGAGRNGRVRLWPSLGKAGAPPTERRRARFRGSDPDRDGVPDAFDVDDDGDLRLDNVDARVPGGARTQDPFQPSSLLNVGLEETFLADSLGLAPGVGGYALNQNAAPPASRETLARLRDLALRTRGLLVFPLPGGPAELDCGALSYCSPGGTGVDLSRQRRFPDGFDADGDGFGLMRDVRPLQPSRDGFGTAEQIVRPIFAFAPQAALRRPGTMGGVGTGDAFVEHIGNGTRQPASLGYVFDSVPAIRSFDDGRGVQQIRYPIAENGPGSERSPIAIRLDRPLTLTVWRPQRRAIPGEAGCPVAARACDEPIDVGGLTYIVAGKSNEPERRTWHCPASAYSVPDDEDGLRPGRFGVTDLATDRPTSPERTITFSVDLRRCSNDGEGGDWGGQPSRDVYVTAVSRYGDAAEGGGLALMGGG